MMPTLKFIQINGRSQEASQDERTNAVADVRQKHCICILGIEPAIGYVHFLILRYFGPSLLHGATVY